jgi:hypothetical protein
MHYNNQTVSELSAKSGSINTYTPTSLDITNKSLSALNSTLLIWLLGDNREMEIRVKALYKYRMVLYKLPGKKVGRK